MSINKIEMQDTNGNTLYPHTSGDLVQYSTTQTVIQKIDEAITNLTNLKSNLVTAVNNKTGSSLTSNSSLADITAKINAIITLNSGSSDATATASQILSGSTAYVKGSKVTGTMTDQGAKTSSLNCGASYTIPAGYHNGSGKVTANSLASQTNATATAANILSGQTAYVNGSKITGTMANLSSNSSILYENGNSTKVIVGDQAFGPITNTDGTNRVLIRYNSTNGYVTGNTLVGVSTSNMASQLGITANKIVSGNTICGVQGTATLTTMGGRRVFYGDYIASNSYENINDVNGSSKKVFPITISNVPFNPSVIFAMSTNGTMYTIYWHGEYSNDYIVTRLSRFNKSSFTIGAGTCTLPGDEVSRAYRVYFIE